LNLERQQKTARPSPGVRTVDVGHVLTLSKEMLSESLRVKFSGKLRQNIEERHPYLRQWGALALAAKVGDFIPLLCSSAFGSVRVNEGKLQFQKLTCAHAHDNVSSKEV